MSAVIPRPCAICQQLTSLRMGQPFVEIQTSEGPVRLWLCSQVCAWQAGVHSAPLASMRPITLLKLQQLFRGNGVEVLR